MVTAGILPFMENSQGRAGNRTRDLVINGQTIWPLDHEAGHNTTLKWGKFSVIHRSFATTVSQQCHNSVTTVSQVSQKCLNRVTTVSQLEICDFSGESLKVLMCYNFLWVQRRHNCSQAASFANCFMTLCLLKVHLQTFLSIPRIQKCQILSCDNLVANERHTTYVPHYRSLLFPSRRSV